MLLCLNAELYQETEKIQELWNKKETLCCESLRQKWLKIPVSTYAPQVQFCGTDRDISYQTVAVCKREAIS